MMEVRVRSAEETVMNAMSAVNQVMAAQNAALSTQIDTAMLRKSLDAMEAEGEAAVQLLQAAAEQAAAMLASTPGMGKSVDVVA